MLKFLIFGFFRINAAVSVCNVQSISWVLFKLMSTNPFLRMDQNEPFQKTTSTLRANHAFDQFELINCRAAQSFINAQHPFTRVFFIHRP